MEKFEPHDTHDFSCAGCNVNDVVHTIYERLCPDSMDDVINFIAGLMDCVAGLAVGNAAPGHEEEVLRKLGARFILAFRHYQAEAVAQEAQGSALQ